MTEGKKMRKIVIITVIIAISAITAAFAAEGADERMLTVYLKGVYSAKVSLIPFEGPKAIYLNPVAEVSGVKNDETATIKIPGQYLPGEFVLRIDYRAKETDSPYPAERVIYINKQDIELFVNPPYINNDEKIRFNAGPVRSGAPRRGTSNGAGETENTVYSVFMKENNIKRMPMDLLRQFLLNYDQPESKLYTEAVKEFEERRIEYNAWLAEQAEKYRELYVSRLFQFQYIPAVDLSGDEKERMNQIIKNYFEGIDFSDPMIIRSRELSKFMDVYMGLYGMQATTLDLRDSLFTQAGSVACEKASKGNPQVYGWMVDYFYSGYETYNIKKGIEMLQQHINNSNCLTSKKQQIIQRLESISRLVPKALSPDFVMKDNIGKSFQFHKWKPKARYKLLLFWTTTCANCLKLMDELSLWHNLTANKKKLDIVAVNLDEPEIGTEKWESAIVNLFAWKHLHAKGGVNSAPARDYAILSTPAMFLIGSKDNVIVSAPGSLEQLVKDLQ